MRTLKRLLPGTHATGDGKTSRIRRLVLAFNQLDTEGTKISDETFAPLVPLEDILLGFGELDQCEVEFRGLAPSGKVDSVITRIQACLPKIHAKGWLELSCIDDSWFRHSSVSDLS